MYFDPGKLYGVFKKWFSKFAKKIKFYAQIEAFILNFSLLIYTYCRVSKWLEYNNATDST